MDDITTDAQASAAELQQRAAADYASARAARARAASRDDVPDLDQDRSAA
ncbi:hypothetical protein [Streptomyces sp. NPDC056013]